jgi:tetratricopeptide (TPR) repeat protein
LSPWRKQQLTAASLRALRIAGFPFLVFAFLLGIDLLQEDPSTFLSVAATAVGVVAAVLAIVSFSLHVSRSEAPRPLDLRSPKSRADKRMVDRDGEVAELTKKIGASEVVNCHGARGAGKSFALQYLADVINGHRQPNPDHTWPQGISVALYFDLSDAIGFEGIEEQVCRAAIGKKGTWDQFVGYVARKFSGRRILLILDNVNSPSLWTPVGQAAFGYLLKREGDILLIGSIDELELHNLDVTHMRMDGLAVDAFIELARLEGLALDEEQLVALHSEWDGLPYYAGPMGAGHAALAEGVDLSSGTRRLVAYAALFAVITRRISVRELKRCPIVDVETHLAEAIENERLLTPTDDGHWLTMHDIARDDVLHHFEPEVPEAAAVLFEHAHRRGNDVDAAVFAMFADPARIGTERFDSVLLPVIREAVESRNYALLDSLHQKSRSNQRLLEFLAADRGRSDLFSFSRASQLAGLGEYEDAEAELLETSIASTRVDHVGAGSELQLELRYLQADLAHLLNRYEIAALDFEKLAETARADGHERLRARCIWAQGHVLRHQGRDLDRAMDLFGTAEALARDLSMLSVKSRSVTGATGIKVFRGSVSADEEERLSHIEEEVAASTSHDGHMLSIWKYQAQVDWLRGREGTALERIEDAIRKARELNDRLLYNLFFERAEFTRLGGDGLAALNDYERVLHFGRGNRDRNLLANALIGLVLADLATGRWEYHSSKLEARGSAMRARDTAEQADIQITKQLAEQVVAKLDGGLGELPTRLIVF